MKKGEAAHAIPHRLFLLLFFVTGAVLLRFVPAIGQQFVPSRWMAAMLMLLPALLAGTMLGAYVIPFGSLLLGMLCMQRFLTLGVPTGEGLAAWLVSALPLAVLTPVYAALARCGMELSDACMAEYLRSDGRKRQLLLRRQLLIAFCAAAAVTVSYSIF